MPTVREIESALFELAPKELAMDWDNVGLLVGEPEQEVCRVLVALDVTEAVADEAIDRDCQLIVAHHPVMNCKWLPVQNVRSDTPQGRLLIKLLRNRLSAICMHTNLDITAGGVNDTLANRLQLTDICPFAEDGLGRIGTLPEPVSLEKFSQTVCRLLHCNGVRYAGAYKPVQKVAVGGGACGEYIQQAIDMGCDTFVTSDLKYHAFLDAKGQGINLIDAGHFPTEDPVCAPVLSFLRNRFPAVSFEKSQVHREVIQYYVDCKEPPFHTL